MGRAAWALILTLAGAGPAWSGQDAMRALPQLAATPIIDGIAAPDEWDGALELPLAFEVSPLWGVPTEPSAVAWVGTTPDALWVRVDVTQTAPIKATAGKHDSSYGDGVGVRVQPDIKAQRVFDLGVNAAGATRDTIGGSGGGGSPNWDGHWQSAARLTDTGYVIEIRIPWATLELAAAPQGEIGLSVERQINSGRFESQDFNPIDFRQNCLECQFEHFRTGEIRISEEEPEFSTRWLPYAIVSGQRRFDPGTQARIAQDTRSDAGLDALFQWRSGRKILATLNPDFSQVESDAFVSNINRRFAVTYPERRPFFTEESGAFSTPMALLYTRAIGDPSLGLQYVSRSQGSTRAALIADDALTTYLDVGQNGSRFVTLPVRSWNAVYRSTTPFEPGKPSNWGSFVSLRSADGYANGVVAGDVVWQPNSEHQLVTQLAGSYARADAILATQGSASEADFALQASHYFSRDHYSAYTDFSESGPNFRADLGRLSRTDTRSLSHGSAFYWPGSEGARLSGRSINLNVGISDDRHGRLLDSGMGLNGSLQFANEVSLSAGVSANGSRDELSVIRTHSGYISAGAPLHSHLSISGSISTGTSPDYVNSTGGRSRSVSLALSLEGLAHVDGYLYWSRSRFESDRPGAESEVDSAQLRLNLHPSPRHHLSIFLNPFRSDDRLDPNAALREPDAFRQWQLTYTYEPGRFTRLIIGASRSEQGGVGIQGLQPRGELLFAKWVLEL